MGLRRGDVVRLPGCAPERAAGLRLPFSDSRSSLRSLWISRVRARTSFCSSCKAGTMPN